jgi:hypothetical protein
MKSTPRWLRVLVAAYAISFALALVTFVVLLFAMGHAVAEVVWTPVVLIPLFLVGLPIALKYLK